MRTILYETDRLKIEHEFENTWLVDKMTGKVLLEDDFYGEPDVALIDKNNKWAIVAKLHLSIWTDTGRTTSIQTKEFRWIHSLRVKTERIVEVLTDPYSEISAIWEFDIETFEIRKIRDFKKYQGEKYIEDIIW